MAYGIVERLEESRQHDLLIKLQDGVNNNDSKKAHRHQVWGDFFDWKECRSRKMISQKLEYMHNNPTSGIWHLVKNPVDYPHSSAKFYLTGEQGIYEVTNYIELEDIDLTI